MLSLLIIFFKINIISFSYLFEKITVGFKAKHSRAELRENTNVFYVLGFEWILYNNKLKEQL